MARQKQQDKQALTSSPTGGCCLLHAESALGAWQGYWQPALQ